MVIEPEDFSPILVTVLTPSIRRLGEQTRTHFPSPPTPLTLPPYFTSLSSPPLPSLPSLSPTALLNPFGRGDTECVKGFIAGAREGVTGLAGFTVGELVEFAGRYVGVRGVLGERVRGLLGEVAGIAGGWGVGREGLKGRFYVVIRELLGSQPFVGVQMAAEMLERVPEVLLPLPANVGPQPKRSTFSKGLSGKSFPHETLAFNQRIQSCVGQPRALPRALELRAEMEKKGIPFSDVTFNALIHVAACEAEISKAFELKDEMAEHGFDPDRYEYL
jgi:pentatricopeptide repeat protein